MRGRNGMLWLPVCKLILETVNASERKAATLGDGMRMRVGGYKHRAGSVQLHQGPLFDLQQIQHFVSFTVGGKTGCAGDSWIVLQLGQGAA